MAGDVDKKARLDKQGGRLVKLEPMALAKPEAAILQTALNSLTPVWPLRQHVIPLSEGTFDAQNPTIRTRCQAVHTAFCGKLCLPHAGLDSLGGFAAGCLRSVLSVRSSPSKGLGTA